MKKPFNRNMTGKAIALSLAVCVTLMGLGPIRGARADEDAVEIWSTYSTEKILQNEYDRYDDVRLDAAVTVDACRGEYESSQLILTAKQDIRDYTVSVSDLTDGAGNTFSAENILVYHEKYIEVTNLYEGNGAVAGMYPDALLPIEKAVEYGENNIASGNNQGVYLTFNVPVGQEAGTYTGSLTVTYDGAEKTVPVTLTVHDVTVSQTTHTQSKFNVTFAHYLGELNSTQDMLDSYISVMAEYRISPGLIMFGNDSNYSDESIAAYAQKAYDLLQENPKMSTFAVPTPTMTDSSTGLPTLNGSIFEKYLHAIIDVALESYDARSQTGFDLMSYAICTVSIIDEPDLNNTLDRVPGVANQFENAISGSKQYLKAQANEKGISQAFADEIEGSLEDFPLIVSMTTAWAPEEEVADIITSCPLISLYDTAAQRDVYAQQQQRWIYTCNQPTSPYPTYHIDDTLVSARSLSWMMSEYDITGNFYWAADLYQKYVGSGTYLPIDDYYGTAERYERANGDGYLLYPGAPYGMDEPLPSLRLEAIRDGAEEYELWYALHENYEEAGYDWTDIQRKVSSLIYQNAKVVSTSERMQLARQAVISLLEMSESDLAVGITDVVESGSSVTYTVQSAEGCTLTVPENSGIAVSGSSGRWELTLDTSDVEALAFTVTKEGVSEIFSLKESSIRLIGAQELSGATAQGGGTLLKEIVEASSEGIPGTEEDLLKLTFGAVTGSNQYVTVGGDIASSLGKDTKTIVLTIYNPTQEEMPLRVTAKFRTSTYAVSIANETLLPGWNTLEITDLSLTAAYSGAIETLGLYFTDLADNYGERTVYLGKLTVYTF